MTKTELNRVKAWLYSIPKTEYALENLKKALVDLDTRFASPPTWAADLHSLGVTGGLDESKQEKWVQFIDEYPIRRSIILDDIRRQEMKVQAYYETLDAMVGLEPTWGHLGKEIIHLKYYRHIRPDSNIYVVRLYCTKETFYRTMRRALGFYYETLPHVFGRREREIGG